jgi:hypothetical protein
MTINIINPSFNLINTSKTVAASKSGSTAGAASTSTDGSIQNFSEILEDVITNLQNSATTDHTAVSASDHTVSLDDIFQKAADTYHVPVQLLKAVAKAESNFDPMAESSAGAQGIMQLMPATASGLGVSDAFDPEQNIMGGAKYLSEQLARYDGNAVLALAAYNAGPGNVAKYDGVPPFKETQNYISKVMAYAGEPITAGDLAIASNQTPALNTDSILENLGLGLLSADSGNMDQKDYELLLNLYRYKMQLNVLTGDDPDSDSNNSDLFGNLNSLV